MSRRRCTCGAEAHVRSRLRRCADGREELIYEVSCPVCGQTGPVVVADGRPEADLADEAVRSWNEMIARLRPLER